MHQPMATDHIIGLATEFGCGVRGALCHVRGGSPASNGVLGYGDAGKGGTFVKIGVGKLRRPENPHTDGFRYDFAWPYKLAAPPRWHVHRVSSSSVTLLQIVKHKRWGYSLRRKVSSCGQKGKTPALCVDLRLNNTGETELRTPYVSANAINLAGPAFSVGPGASITFSVPNSANFVDAGKLNMSQGYTPLSRLAKLALHKGQGRSHIQVSRRLVKQEVASANFQVPVNSTWDGRFSVTLPAAPGWNLVVRHLLWRSETARRGGWLGFNVRISRRAIWPRPYLLLDVPPGGKVDLTHRFEFEWRPVA